MDSCSVVNHVLAHTWFDLAALYPFLACQCPQESHIPASCTSQYEKIFSVTSNQSWRLERTSVIIFHKPCWQTRQLSGISSPSKPRPRISDVSREVLNNIISCGESVGSRCRSSLSLVPNLFLQKYREQINCVECDPSVWSEDNGVLFCNNSEKLLHALDSGCAASLSFELEYSGNLDAWADFPCNKVLISAGLVWFALKLSLVVFGLN